MSDNMELGQRGESLARRLLLQKGYKIVQNNWRFGKDEVDIICSNHDKLIFIEVKTRKTDYFGEPYLAVNKNKQRFLIRAAQAYVERFDIDLEVRFDIISILLNNTEHRIEHIEDAFYPTL